jgi:xanthine dehydrogenase accessory factor
LVRGIGDVGSAIAVELFRAGYGVALNDDPAPTTPRSGMAFTDTVFDGVATLDGLSARRASGMEELLAMMTARQVVPVTTLPFDNVLTAADWSGLIDARMRKRAQPERQRGLVPLTIASAQFCSG